jgi:ferredoxin
MHPPSRHLMGFSPTGTSRAVLRALAEGFGHAGASYTEMSPRASGTTGNRINPGGVTVPGVTTQDQPAAVAVAVPVYSGRVPEVAAVYLDAIVAARRALTLPPIPAVAIVLYGNRAYDDALLELHDLLSEAGLSVVAAGAFVGEHSYSTDDLPLSEGRPDREDLDLARELGAAFARIVTTGMKPDGTAVHASETDSAGGLILPGNRPYRERKPRSGESPVTDADECILCGACEEACPLGIVSVTDVVDTDAEECMYCCACVKACPNGSRRIGSEHIMEVARWLDRNHGSRRRSELFLPG